MVFKTFRPFFPTIEKTASFYAPYVSSQKEDIYQGKDFADLEPGEFIGSATRANVSYFKVKLEMYDDRNEEPLPDVRVLEPGELGRNFARILEEVRELFPCE